jgi:prolyl 4-hydroxylase
MFDMEAHVDGMQTLQTDTLAAVRCTDGLDAVVAALKVVVAGVRSNRSNTPAQGSVARFELDSRQGFDRWAFYTPHGERIVSVAGLLRCDRTLVFEGGLFVWPGVRLGFRRAVHLPGDSTFEAMTLITRSLLPLVFLVDPLLSDAECDHIIGVTEPDLAVSHVSHFDADLGESSKKWRRSLQARVATNRDPIFSAISGRVAAALKIPREHAEPLQVIKYEGGGKYDAHTDYFNPELYKAQPHMLRMMDGDGSRNRHATLLWYMSDVAEGGETFFPRSGGLAHPPDPRCEGAAGLQGMKVVPSKGKALLFYSLRADGAIDPFSHHGGCPVVRGVKWVVNQWMWSKPYRHL